ncbi:hypothetical protein [Haloarchaeobius litoreus]|uniref:Lipoprotein n=1 Tax=Haloarchaeobius litoreus TaxID=755306 RepID=A0ABD6DE15_9EURY|nr:hypothetical protein [Haloarchaeobius litoreus]
MRRRALLAATATALGSATVAGCLGDGATDGDGTTTHTDAVPENCSETPDIDGLPARPESLTESSVVDYVREFEEVYVVATDDGYAGIRSITVSEVTAVEDGYEVDMAVDGVEPTRTGTATEQPVDATVHRATYRLRGRTLVRELRGHPANRLIWTDCWTVSSR